MTYSIVDGGMDGLAFVADGEGRTAHGVGELLRKRTTLAVNAFVHAAERDEPG